MTSILFPVVWALVGAGGGWFVRWGSVRLARLEELEPGSRGWQVYGPPILASVLFAAFANEMGTAMLPLLLLRSVFVLVLVQVIFFDFEHRLILDRVMFPAMVLALAASLFAQTRLDPLMPWWAGIACGLGAGLLFFLLAVGGRWIFKADAMGFGDVKLAVFMGLLLGPLPTITAIFYGVFLAGLAAVGIILWHRSLKGTLAYGPYLAAGALIVLFRFH
ncbi:MAG TPA: prepilin peptidase [Candidatus Dormibacteraeota bacterium]|nr:prepilin peptidase [Candidatus Dormibacteraeota bacterium]